MSLPPWDQETFSFGWSPYIKSIPQCSTLNVGFDTDLGDPSLHADPAPAPPYTINVYQGGYAPLTIAVGNIGQTGHYPWNVNLPLDIPFMVTMKDSAGYTGGTSQKCTIIPGTGCSVNPMPPATLSFTRTGNSQCGNVNIVVNNGTSPYQVEIIPEVRQQKTLHFATNAFSFVLDLPAGVPHFVVVTDAAGNSAVDGVLAAGASSDNSCLNAATTMTAGMFSTVFSGTGVVMTSTTQAGASGSATIIRRLPRGTIVGAAAGGVIVIAAIMFLLCWLFRRRRAKRRDAAMNQQQDEGSKPEMNQTQVGYSLPYGPQPGFPGVVEPYMPSGQPHDFLHGPPVQYNGITTHAPQARPISQTVSYYSGPNSDQPSSASHSFFQSSGTTSPLMGVHHPVEGSSNGHSWGIDRKERVASSPPDTPAGTSAYPWGMAASPPPRVGTALPSYELATHQEHNQG